MHLVTHLHVLVYNEMFISILDKFCPNWRDTRIVLNELPRGHVNLKFLLKI